LRHPRQFTHLHEAASQRGPRMSVAIITGSAGLVGSEAVLYFSNLGFEVVGIDNGMRAEFFAPAASARWVRDRLRSQVPGYVHRDVDIRDSDAISQIFARYGHDVSLVIHAAAQPSHDWAASNPPVDFSVNANGTSVLLEATHHFAPDAVFVFMSTNKVYGDTPNLLPLVERDTRWELPPSHSYGSQPFRHATPRFSRLPDEVHRYRYSVLHLRLQEKTGSRQYPQRRSHPRVPPLFRTPTLRGGLQHRRRPQQQLFHARSHHPLRKHHRQKTPHQICRGKPPRRPHLVDQRSLAFPGALSHLATAV